MKIKNILIVLFILVFLVFAYILAMIIKPTIELNNLNVEINSDVTLYSLIKKVNLGEVVTSDYVIDTSELGDQVHEIELKTYFREYKYEFIIKIVDTTRPTIEANQEITTFVYEEVDLLNNVIAKDNSKEELEIKVLGEYDFNKMATYYLKYYVKDSSGNENFQDFTLNVLENGNKSYRTSKGYTVIIQNGIATINDIVIVNKSYSLPSWYGSGLTSETNNAFLSMQQDASKKGINLFIASGFRSYQSQVDVYQKWVNLDGKDVADTYSARAGYSEHQAGIALDLNQISSNFSNTKEFKWLQENAYKYGFILRYPRGKQEITGYIYEPWHYRYVGVDLASELYNQGNWITIEEYFGIDSRY